MLFGNPCPCTRTQEAVIDRPIPEFAARSRCGAREPTGRVGYVGATSSSTRTRADDPRAERAARPCVPDSDRGARARLSAVGRERPPGHGLARAHSAGSGDRAARPRRGRGLRRLALALALALAASSGAQAQAPAPAPAPAPKSGEKLPPSAKPLIYDFTVTARIVPTERAAHVTLELGKGAVYVKALLPDRRSATCFPRDGTRGRRPQPGPTADRAVLRYASDRPPRTSSYDARSVTGRSPRRGSSCPPRAVRAVGVTIGTRIACACPRAGASDAVRELRGGGLGSSNAPPLLGAGG